MVGAGVWGGGGMEVHKGESVWEVRRNFKNSDLEFFRGSSVGIFGR